MYDMFLRFATTFTGIYFLKQLLVILGITLMGYLLFLYADNSANNGKSIVSGSILAFPLGISVFLIEAYLMLSIGVPYNTASVSIVLLLTAMCFAYLLWKSGKIEQTFNGNNKKTLIILGAAVIALAAFACSGLAPISISNDSMYYFHEYPRYIVYFGGLRDQFDSFLTDTGLGSVAIETLPFLFGFNESFGIREYMHICFLLFLTLKVYDRSGSKWAAGIVGLLTAASSPVYVLGHWAMANMYFMEFFFMAAVLMADASAAGSNGEEKMTDILPAAVLSVACSLLRMEGGIFILFLIGCFTLSKINGRRLIFGIALPILVMLGIYEIKIYAFYDIDNPYTFLTPQKAMLQAAAFVCVIIYIAFIRNRLPGKIKGILPVLFILVLTAANGVLLIYNRELYMANLTAFYRNIMGQSGWGMLPQLLVGSIVVLIAGTVIKPGRAEDLSSEIYFTTLTVGFVLVTVAVSFMRGDALDVQVGDSGNRVMMQAAPFMIYTVTLYFIRLYERFREDDN